jgi:cytochrome c biogenesis factor
LNYLIDLKYNLIILIFIFFLLTIVLNIYLLKSYIWVIIYVYIEYFNIKDGFGCNIYDLNTNLINGFFLIHPLLIYIFYVLLLLLFLLTLLNMLDLNYRNNIIYAKLLYVCIYTKNIATVLYLIILVIFLGSWWAYQELSWGTWWNWDPIEIINLLYLLSMLTIQHKSLSYFIKSFYKIFYKIFFLTLLLFIVVRYSLVQSIHNFLNVTTQNQYNIYIYIYSIIYIYMFKYTRKSKINNYFNNSNYLNYLYKFNLSFFLVQFLLNILNFNFIFFINYLSYINVLFIALYLLYYILNSFSIAEFKLKNIINYTVYDLYGLYKLYYYIRLYKFIHINFFIFILIIYNFYFNIKLSYIYITNYVDYIYILQDNNLITNYIELKLNKIISYNQSIFFFNTKLNLNFSTYDSYSSQLSNINYLLPSWVEYSFNSNKYLFAYLYNVLVVMLIIFFNFIHIKQIRKIYY